MEGQGPSLFRPCGRPDLAALLPEWKELAAERRSELEAHARGCGSCGRELEVLVRADRWLEAGGLGSEGSAPVLGSTACPSAEELYDFAGGPGARPLAGPVRRDVAEHVERCRACEELVATLATRPPVPLLLDPEPEAEATAVPAVARRASTRRWLVPLAAAAGIAAVLLWRETRAGAPDAVGGSTASIGVRYPDEPVLRGEAPGALLFPRDRVLALSPSELFAPLAFELAPQEGARGYRIGLERGGATPFDSGERIASKSSLEPRIELAPGEARLEPGRYTWEAWADVDGLDQLLGRRDFEVVVDRELADLASAARAALDVDGLTRALALLEERGFGGDARALARSLPPSPERDQYLARVPGR